MISYNRLFILISFSLLFCSLLKGQESDSLFLKGNVISAESKEPVAFANIWVSNSTFYTITDTSGYFELKFPVSYKNDSIRISCLGYSKLTIPINIINPDNKLVIELEDTLFLLDEATAVAYDYFIGLFWNTGKDGEKRYFLTTATRDLINVANFIKILKSELGEPKTSKNILRWNKVDIKQLGEKKLNILLTYFRCKYCPNNTDINILISVKNKKDVNLLDNKKKEEEFSQYFQSLLNQTFAQGVDYNLLEKRDNIYYLVNDTKPYTGNCFAYYESGERGLKGSFNNGLKDGKWIYWYKNGQKKLEVNYVNGQKHGTWKYWYSNGVIKMETNYNYGKMVGVNKWYYENGQLKKEALYKDGVFYSKKEYDEKGNLIDKTGDF